MPNSDQYIKSFRLSESSDKRDSVSVGHDGTPTPPPLSDLPPEPETPYPGKSFIKRQNKINSWKENPDILSAIEIFLEDKGVDAKDLDFILHEILSEKSPLKAELLYVAKHPNAIPLDSPAGSTGRRKGSKGSQEEGAARRLSNGRRGHKRNESAVSLDAPASYGSEDDTSGKSSTPNDSSGSRNGGNWKESAAAAVAAADLSRDNLPRQKRDTVAIDRGDLASALQALLQSGPVDLNAAVSAAQKKLDGNNRLSACSTEALQGERESWRDSVNSSTAPLVR